jgi:hypothetical protein
LRLSLRAGSPHALGEHSHAIDAGAFGDVDGRYDAAVGEAAVPMRNSVRSLLEAYSSARRLCR